MNITADDRSRWINDGVVCIRDALPEPWLREAEKAWQWSMDHPGPLASPLTPGSSARQDLCNPQALAHYQPLLERSPLKDIAQELMGSDNVWFMYEQVFHKSAAGSPRTPWHQDTSYLAINGPQVLAMWISFEPIAETAALEFVRGSHHGTLYNTSRFDADDETLPIFDSDDLPRLPAIEADRSAYDLVRFATQPGDIIAFHTSMLHGGGATDETTQERRTLTLRFFGDNAHFEQRPGPAGPFYEDIAPHIVTGAPFRHERFLHLVGAGA